MRTITKAVRIAHASGQSIERALFTFLREYRLTPHSTTGIAPSFLCLGRRVGDVIPHHPSWEAAPLPPNREGTRRAQTNERTSQHGKARPSPLKEGDQVLIRDRHPGSKFRLPFEPKRWTVTSVKGTMVTAKNGDDNVTCNISFFKRYIATTPREARTEQEPGRPGTIPSGPDGGEGTISPQSHSSPTISEEEVMQPSNASSNQQQRSLSRNRRTRYCLRAHPS